MTEIVPDGPAPSPATAAQLLVAALERFGVERVFGVPGESFLAVLDALVDSPIAFVPNRHEGGAAFMAEATAKLTGRPGVCFVTRGPGSPTAAIGVHSAMQAATPMVLFVGQVERASRGRGAFQEIDQAAMFAPVAKAAFELDDPDRVTEIVARAWATAVGGRPGPVVVALPEDVIAAPSRARPLSRAVEAFPPPADPAAAQATARALLHAE
ncbi:MAG: thiamine pyrophosphate-binding protein, partial [Paracoccaceae bacterium]